MEFAFDLSLLGWAGILVAALAFGLIAQFVGETRTGFEWLADAVAFAIGAVFASEFVTAWQTVDPVWEGVALIPALAGGLVLGLIVEVATRMLTGGHYTHHPAAV